MDCGAPFPSHSPLVCARRALPATHMSPSSELPVHGKHLDFILWETRFPMMTSSLVAPRDASE